MNCTSIWTRKDAYVSSSGIAIDEFSPSISPREDLFGHVNRRWVERTEIPADRASAGTFLTLRDEAEDAVRELIEGASTKGADPTESKIAALYQSFMDESAIEAKGLLPAQDALDSIERTNSFEDLVELSGKLQRRGVAGLVGFYVANDPGNPQRYLAQLFQAGLGLPDESYYRLEQFEQVRESYLEHIQTLFTLAGLEDAEGAAERIVALETALARVHWDKVSMRDPQKTYNLMTQAQLQALSAPMRPWFDGVEASNSVRSEVVVATPDYFAALASLGENYSLRSWQDWLRMRVLSFAAPYLSSDFVQENFAFYGTALSGTESIRPRWRRAVSCVEEVLGEAVGQLYVAKHFPEAHKVQMEQLVSNLLEAYKVSIENLSWMSDVTKDKALEKLAKFTPKIGYPATWRDYGTLEISTDDLLGNVMNGAEAETARYFAKVGAPIDRDEWLMTPQTVNAYYYPVMNEIVFPAAILQYPFFDPSRDDAANYGAIGAVIGHEIGHGFDDKGSQFDGDGALKNWWSDDDRAAFDALTSKLVEQYQQLHPLAAPEINVNGELTLGENIGDLGGLGIAYRAWLSSLNGAEPERIDGLSGAERFFLSWAQAWRGVNRPKEALRRATTDPHSPNEWRCNQVVKNLSAFHDTFATQPADSMWLAPEDRVEIW